MTELRRTHYDVLGIRPGANAAAIRAAYLNLARLVHPDRHHHGDAPEQALAERRMREVTAAWATLGDPILRAQYDRDLARGRPSPAPDHDDAVDVDDRAEEEEEEEEEDGIVVGRAVFHLLTKGPLLAMVAVALMILVFTAYARPSISNSTTPGSTAPTLTTPSTFGMDPDR